jgi:four helix bundle protein
MSGGDTETRRGGDRRHHNKRIQSHRELQVHGKAFDTAMEIFEFSRSFPREETYSLTDQVRRSSRAVCANLAEAWRKRRYEGAFVFKLTDAECEAAETQLWIEFAVKCGYLDRDPAAGLYATYEEILRMLVAMINHPESWLLRRK